MVRVRSGERHTQPVDIALHENAAVRHGVANHQRVEQPAPRGVLLDDGIVPPRQAGEVGFACEDLPWHLDQAGTPVLLDQNGLEPARERVPVGPGRSRGVEGEMVPVSSVAKPLHCRAPAKRLSHSRSCARAASWEGPPQGRPACRGSEGLLDMRERERAAHILGHAAHIQAHAIAGGDVVWHHVVISHVVHDVMHLAEVQSDQRAC